jgi:hypothetical protein
MASRFHSLGLRLPTTRAVADYDVLDAVTWDRLPKTMATGIAHGRHVRRAGQRAKSSARVRSRHRIFQSGSNTRRQDIAVERASEGPCILTTSPHPCGVFQQRLQCCAPQLLGSDQDDADVLLIHQLPAT